MDEERNRRKSPKHPYFVWNALSINSSSFSVPVNLSQAQNSPGGVGQLRAYLMTPNYTDSLSFFVFVISFHIEILQWDRPRKVFAITWKQDIFLEIWFTKMKEKYNCSGPPAFKSQRVRYQSNQNLLHHYQH